MSDRPGEVGVSTSDEILQGLQQAGAGVGQSLAAAAQAKQRTEAQIATMAAAGIRDKIAEYTAVKAAIEETIASLNGSREKLVQTLNRARAAAG
jgi:hypothetical protein